MGRANLGYFVRNTWHYFLLKEQWLTWGKFSGSVKILLKILHSVYFDVNWSFCVSLGDTTILREPTKHSWQGSRFVCLLQDKVGREWPITKVYNKISYTFEDNCGILFQKHLHFISRSKLTHYEQFLINKTLSFPVTNLTYYTFVKLYFIN